MFSLLHQYLINSSQLALPGIGTLQFVESPAQAMPNGHLISPKQTVVLVNSNVTENEPKLISFLCRQLDMTETQAQALFGHFLESVTASIASRETVLWENLGMFKKDDSGIIRFFQDDAIGDYLPPVEESWVNRHDISKYDILIGDSETNNIAVYKESESTKPKSNYWWVWAIIIVVIALAVIFYKFYY